MSAPSSIVIVGLGPGDSNLRTIGAQQTIDLADAIILRTRVHPGIDDLAHDPRVTDCDDLYSTASGFEELYVAIADRVIDRSIPGKTLVYAVPGHPRFAERSVAIIEAKAEELGMPVSVLDAVSFVDTAATVTRTDPVASGLQIRDALQLAAVLDAQPYGAGQLGIDPTRPLLLAQVYNSEIAATVKIALSRIYPDEQPIVVLRGVGIPGEELTQAIVLHALDRHAVDHLTSIWVAPMAPLDAVRSAETLARIVARLRAPGGCPWDREQTHATLRNAVLAEAYETVDAIDTGDEANLAEELGDLLLLVTMHAQLAEESGAFRIEDVHEAITRKLIRRHPHVFGSVQAATPDEVIATWEGVKQGERASKGSKTSDDNRYDRLPRSMPALRKVIELVAPRAQFTASSNGAGDEVLEAVIRLIDRSIDPELALEASLRNRTSEFVRTTIAAGSIPSRPSGKEHA